MPWLKSSDVYYIAEIYLRVRLSLCLSFETIGYTKMKFGTTAYSGIRVIKGPRRYDDNVTTDTFSEAVSVTGVKQILV